MTIGSTSRILQRQVLHRTEDVGRLKVESAKEQLLALDPNLTIVEHKETT